MNWKNFDLKSSYERDQNIIEPLSFNTLLLEVSSNIKNINKKTVIEQFELDLRLRIESAREVFEDNLDNIVADALEYQNID